MLPRAARSPFTISFSGRVRVGGPESGYNSMEREPGNRHWLQNMNDRQQTRPGPTGRPNGQTPQPRPFSTLNRWLLIIVLIMLGVFVYNYFNTVANNSNAPQRAELTYTDFYNQIAAKNIKTATFIGQT